MSNLQKITRLKKELEEASADRAQQEGALKERKRALKDLCGTDDLDKALKKLEKIQDEVETNEEELEVRISQFEERYADLLN